MYTVGNLVFFFFLSLYNLYRWIHCNIVDQYRQLLRPEHPKRYLLKRMLHFKHKEATRRQDDRLVNEK